MPSPQQLDEACLYGILDTGYLSSDEMPAMAKKLIAGGIDILQLRAKKSTEEEIMAMAVSIQPLTKAAGVLLIINDYPHLVQKIKADGAHIGQDDMSVSEARRLAGPKAIIGLSTHSLEQVQGAVAARPDYIGFGPLFATPTKPDYKPIGVADIEKAYQLVTVPIFCIGGITGKNLPDVIAAGAKRVVIVSDLLKANAPEIAARYCKNLLRYSKDFSSS